MQVDQALSVETTAVLVEAALVAAALEVEVREAAGKLFVVGVVFPVPPVQFIFFV